MATTQQPGTAVATPADEPKGITALMEAARDRIEPLLPEGVKYERVMREVYFVTKKTPALLKCSGESIIQAVAKVQQWGLEIGETAHIVPFKGQAVAIADYKGLAALMIGTGAVRAVEARCVYANEEFDYEQGLDARLRHIPQRDAAARGALIGAYCIIRLPFGQATFDFFPIGDIDAIRQAYSQQWKAGPCPPWYAKKTAVRQLAKLMPKNPRLTVALRVLREDEEIEATGALLSASPAPLALGAGDDDTPTDEPEYRGRNVSAGPDINPGGYSAYVDTDGRIASEGDDARASMGPITPQADDAYVMDLRGKP